MLAEDDELVKSIMEENVISVTTLADQEQVAQMFSNYNFLALPVVDNENRLVGIVTIDDAIDVIQEEATEDIEKMAAVLPSDKPYMKTSVFGLYKRERRGCLYSCFRQPLQVRLSHHLRLCLQMF